MRGQDHLRRRCWNSGPAIELRVYAEDPVRFLPSPGQITRWDEPSGEGIRVDGGYRADDVVTPHYDPLPAKGLRLSRAREDALQRAREAIDAFAIEGLKVKLAFLGEVLDCEGFVPGDCNTEVVTTLRSE